MTNRTRKIVLRVPVTPEERELIRQKMALLHTRNFSAYARKMLIDGYVVHIDTTDIRAQTAELQKIGVNVNQIARRLNSMGPLYTRNFSAYARKMLIDGYVVHIDTTDIRAQTAELQKIGVNVNQIARRLNSMGPLYTQDVADIKGALAQIWQLQRYILSSQR